MEYKDNLEVEIFLFENENLDNLRLVFSGTAKNLREVDENWDGFETGERFHLEDQEVRVCRKSVFIENPSSVPKHTYYVGPTGLNVYKINLDKVDK